MINYKPIRSTTFDKMKRRRAALKYLFKKFNSHYCFLKNGILLYFHENEETKEMQLVLMQMSRQGIVLT